MKLPFDLGVKLIFRILLPGFIITLGVMPALYAFMDWGGFLARIEIALFVCMFFSGWLITVADMPVYMLFEGRRYRLLWPGWLWDRMLRSEWKRLEGIKKTIEAHGDSVPTERLAERKFHEAYFDLRKFPINAEGDYYAKFPTRFGNLLEAFECYPERIYGMSGVFYWTRIWLVMDKDLREEIDGKQAVADSATYTSFALYLTGVVWLAYLLLAAANTFATHTLGLTLTTSRVTLFDYLPPWPLMLAVSAACILLGYFVYRLSIHAQAQFGELFKSMFDTNFEKVAVSGVIDELASLTGRPTYKTLTRKKQMQHAWRYLQHYRLRCPDCNKLLKPSEAAGHRCEVAREKEPAALPAGHKRPAG